MSAYESSGNSRLTGSSTSRSMPRPAFAPSSDSGAKRIVAPSEPPVWSAALYVPLACHARRTAIGHEFAFWLMSSLRISLFTAL